ncbi:MAG: hypothetical protein OSA48_06210 [Akkermansiaceae bacterium]|nr:hypothetical protein [Akkermansiaceae bacterium]
MAVASRRGSLKPAARPVIFLDVVSIPGIAAAAQKVADFCRKIRPPSHSS